MTGIGGKPREKLFTPTFGVAVCKAFGPWRGATLVPSSIGSWPTGFVGFGVDHASLPAPPTVGIRFVFDSNVGTGNVSSGVKFRTG
uniref:Uncharacterized protein n=1 Tax=Anopheles minimus TaxID=112268 RepID=A0A182WQH0_9DIPT